MQKWREIRLYDPLTTPRSVSGKVPIPVPLGKNKLITKMKNQQSLVAVFPKAKLKIRNKISYHSALTANCCMSMHSNPCC